MNGLFERAASDADETFLAKSRQLFRGPAAIAPVQCVRADSPGGCVFLFQDAPRLIDMAAEVEVCRGSREVHEAVHYSGGALRLVSQRPHRAQGMMQPCGCLKWKSVIHERLQHLRYVRYGRKRLRDNTTHSYFGSRPHSADRLESGLASRVHGYFKVCLKTARDLFRDALDYERLAAFDFEGINGKPLADLCGQRCPVRIFSRDHAESVLFERIAGNRRAEFTQTIQVDDEPSENPGVVAATVLEIVVLGGAQA